MKTKEDNKEPGAIDVLEFSEETRSLLEALSEDDDERPVQFRNVGPRKPSEPPQPQDGDEEQQPEEGEEDKNAAGHPVDPNDPEHRDPQDDVEIHDEDERASSPADWATVSVRQARQFLHDHPEANIDIVFPTVYEEDRTAKIADLDAAYTAKAISHQRMSETMAKELGYDQYNYDEEMQKIEDEKPPSGGGLGQGDALAALMQGAQADPSVSGSSGSPLDNLRKGPFGGKAGGPGKGGGAGDHSTLRDLKPGEGPRDELTSLRKDERGQVEAEGVGKSGLSQRDYTLLRIEELARELNELKESLRK